MTKIYDQELSMKKLFAAFAVSFCLVFTQGVYAEAKKAAKKTPAATEASPAAPAGITGKVVQTMNSGGYTYVQIENNGSKLWVAVTQADVKKGQVVTFRPGVVMENFESKTLKRKFDKIVFSDGLASPQTAAQEVKTTGSKDKVIKTKEKIKIEKAASADAYTVEELYKNKAKLNHKSVTVKGKVVKVSPGIMQRNWVHIQDGTGDAKKGTHNLVVTTTSENLPAKEDVVTATGTFFKDKDFGYGYKYDAIVEDATITK